MTPRPEDRTADWQQLLHADATAVLRAWQPADAEQRSRATDYLAFLAAHADAAARSCPAGHLTASTLVVAADRDRVLLTLHPKVGRWLQVGGHLEPADRSIAAAARREATEESGIPDLRLAATPLRLDRHRGHCRRDLPEIAWPDHLDVQFLALAPPGAQPARSEESLDLRWFAWDDLPDLPDADAALLALAETARRSLTR